MSTRAVQKTLLWIFWAAHVSLIIWFWAINSGQLWWQDAIPPALALGRLAGLLATFAALTQFVLMGREGWLEPVFGLDRLTHFHRLNGYAAILLMLAHPVLLAFAYAELTKQNFLQQYLQLLQMPYVLLASLALLLFLIIVGLSIYIVRKHLKFETWYYVHLFTYLAIALVPLHQLTNGGDLSTDRMFATYWIMLYVFAALNVLIWRIGRPFYLSVRYQFEVAKIVHEAPRATSVYIKGRHLADFRAQGGQFVLVRFLTRKLWWQEHPFSLSMLPEDDMVRLTIRQQGDFTNEIPNLKPGTKVAISGPHGAFVLNRATNDKLLFIAGGIGITPLKAMLQQLAQQQSTRDVVLLYGNRTQQEIPLKTELEKLTARIPLTIHHVVSNEADWPGEKGFIDQEKIQRLVPNLQERDVFLCGPLPMMRGVRQALRALGVADRHVYFERFSLHPKD